jgi:hypothetical protein
VNKATITLKKAPEFQVLFSKRHPSGRKRGLFMFFLAAAAAADKDDDCDKNDYPGTAVLATEERIKASHSESSFLLYTMTRRNRW